MCMFCLLSFVPTFTKPSVFPEFSCCIYPFVTFIKLACHILLLPMILVDWFTHMFICRHFETVPACLLRPNSVLFPHKNQQLNFHAVRCRHACDHWRFFLDFCLFVWHNNLNITMDVSLSVWLRAYYLYCYQLSTWKGLGQRLPQLASSLLLQSLIG
jgi:hypothetical protein